MSTVDWVAWPPGGYQVRGPQRQPRYTGPPSYPIAPRWGFPLVTWRRSTSFEPVPVSDLQRARSLAGTAQPLLWLAAGTALLTAAAEVWRYLLLLDSRFDALPAGQLRVSDALVVTGGVVSVVACVLAGLITVGWVIRAYPAAAALAGVRPTRTTRDLLVGWLVPGLNLSVPGSTLAELEHNAMGRGEAARPTPSPLVRAWWTTWVVGGLAATATLLWALRDSTRAQADGVLLHAGVDVLAAATAVLTVVVIRTYTRLLQPTVPGRWKRMVVVPTPPADAGPTSGAGARPAAAPKPADAGPSAGARPSAGAGPEPADAGSRPWTVESAGDGQGGEAADDELGAPRRLAGQGQLG